MYSSNDKQLLGLVAAASSDIHGVGNACMFRDQCRDMAARIAELEAALRPFAKEAKPLRTFDETDPLWAGAAHGRLAMLRPRVADLRRAAAALGEGVGG